MDEHLHPDDQPDHDDVLKTVLEELNAANDQRMFGKALIRKQARLLELAAMEKASLQARCDQLQQEVAELRGEAVPAERP